ncbi:hypothetical protein Pelo_7012 [Pelomyxa schiedti]|nr:hypothetical protein Pelo_7012 [Pelomyxa schiedti]
MLALALASHPRCGRSSPAGIMGPDIHHHLWLSWCCSCGNDDRCSYGTSRFCIVIGIDLEHCVLRFGISRDLLSVAQSPQWLPWGLFHRWVDYDRYLYPIILRESGRETIELRSCEPGDSMTELMSNVRPARQQLQPCNGKWYLWCHHSATVMVIINLCCSGKRPADTRVDVNLPGVEGRRIQCVTLGTYSCVDEVVVVSCLSDGSSSVWFLVLDLRKTYTVKSAVVLSRTECRFPQVIYAAPLLMKKRTGQRVFIVHGANQRANLVCQFEEGTGCMTEVARGSATLSQLDDSLFCITMVTESEDSGTSFTLWDINNPTRPIKTVSCESWSTAIASSGFLFHVSKQHLQVIEASSDQPDFIFPPLEVHLRKLSVSNRITHNLPNPAHHSQCGISGNTDFIGDQPVNLKRLISPKKHKMAGATHDANLVGLLKGSSFVYAKGEGESPTPCDPRYICVACKAPAHEPVIHDCTAWFCAACAIETKQCPSCGEDIAEGSTRPSNSKVILAKLAALDVHCPVCNVKVQRVALKEHVLQCPIDCPKGCGMKVAPQKQESHEQNECLSTFVICETCNETVQRKRIKDMSHKEEDCPTACMHGCGMKVKPKERKEHDTSCAMLPIVCTAKPFCTWTGPRCELKSHTELCIVAKVAPAIANFYNEKLSAMQETIDALHKQIQQSDELREKQVRELTNVVATLQQRDSLLEKQLNEFVEKANVYFQALASDDHGLLCVIKGLCPEGIQQEVPESVLLTGWHVHYKEPYSHHTTPQNVDPGRGDWILVASQKVGSKVLSLAAVGRRSHVCTKTTSPSQASEEHRGVFWYFMDGRSFGFATTRTISLGTADTCDDGGDKRLSWHIDGNGGYRSGTTKDLNDSGEWTKIVCWA